MEWLDKLDDVVDRALVMDQGATNDNRSNEHSQQQDDNDSQLQENVASFRPLHEQISRLRTNVNNFSELSMKQLRRMQESSVEIISDLDMFQTGSSLTPSVAMPDVVATTLEPGRSTFGETPRHDADLMPNNRDFDTPKVQNLILSPMSSLMHAEDEIEPSLIADASSTVTFADYNGNGENTNFPFVIHHESNIPSEVPDHEHLSAVPIDTGAPPADGIEMSADTLDHEADYSDFVQLPLKPWNEEALATFDSSLNCYGIVHVRLVCAQRLPCPVGSVVQGIVALPPWKGRVRTETTTAFLGPGDVCVRWDQLSDAGCCSMVHAWNSQDTPIPTIKIDLMFHPLQMLEFVMCSLQLSCEPLMRYPGIWKRQWCLAENTDVPLESGDIASIDDWTPLILVEAAFVPSDFDEQAESSTDAEDPIESIEDSFEENHEASAPARGTPTPTLSGKSHAPRSIVSAPSFLLISRHRTKPHLLRVQSFWVPGMCAVCSNILVGWKRGYRCEACDIDCCSDCQLQVDLQVPCGSALAKETAEASLHTKLTFQNFLSVIAPVDRSVERASQVGDRHAAAKSKSRISAQHDEPPSVASDETKRAIGSLRLNVIRACLFQRKLPPDTNPEDLSVEGRDVRKGDHYVRITWTGSKESRRTRTIQNSGRPQFDSDEMVFDVQHYGMEYRLEVIDANTDKRLGTTLLTAQGLLQLQRDAMIAENGFALVAPFRRPKSHTEKRRMVLELRTGVKTGFGSDFYSSSIPKSPSKSDESPRHGEIPGWIEIDACLTEDMDRLYSSTPIECPPRPPDELNMDMFQVHVARIASLVDDVKKIIAKYQYIVSWKDPALTSLSLILFVGFCFRFNSEYVGSLPVAALVLFMFYLASIRKRGRLKDRFVSREKAAYIQGEKKVSLNYSQHRPIGHVKIEVNRGENIRSRDLGLPGRVGCRVYWDPLRYVSNEKRKEAYVALDPSLKASHDIGLTNFQYAVNPVWDSLHESIELRRLKQLLPSQSSLFESELHRLEDASSSLSNERSELLAKHAAINFPVLQPIKAGRMGSVPGNDSSQLQSNVQLEAWNASPGAVVIEVRFQDIPGFDNVFGEASFPLSKLIENGEICGWFKILEVGSTHVFPVENIGENKSDRLATHPADGETEGSPKVLLTLQWCPPDSNVENIEMDREASIVIAEELTRSAMRSQASKLDLIGSSIGAINTVRGLSGNVQFIQNTLGSVLDAVESIRNAFNFTDPYKSSVVLALLCVTWAFLALVPTRVLVLAGGLGQYAATFVAAFGSSTLTTGDLSKPSEESNQNNQGSPVVTWLLNAIRGLPTDEDLRKAYFWESRRAGERESRRLASEKRSSRLQRLWKAHWYASVRMKSRDIQRGSLSSSGVRDWHWEDVFAIVQGRRILWWPSPDDFDNGESPTGRIFLAGHAGIAGLSPLDLRELQRDEIPLAVNIFGRGIEGQQKLTILVADEETKQALESAILSASEKED